MKSALKLALLSAATFSQSHLAWGEDKPLLTTSITNFVEKFCSDCHNDFLEDGDRSFDAFLEDPNAEKHHLTVEEILDQLNLGKMPKPGKDVLQPTNDERRAVTAELTEYLSLATASVHPSETPLRRLTRVEYENTMQDLFGIDPETSKAIARFTPDANVHGFQNLGRAQSLSHTQLNSYLKAAEEFLDSKLERTRQMTVEPTRSIFTADDIGVVTDAVTDKPFGSKNGPIAHMSPHALAVKSKDHSFLDIGSGRENAERPYYPRSIFENGGVPVDGQYIIRIKAEALNRFNEYDAQKIGFDAAKQPLKLSIGVAPDNKTFDVSQTAQRKHVEFIDLPDDGPQEFEIKIRMNKGNVPFFFWPNGPHNPEVLMRRTMKVYHPEALEKNIYPTGQLLIMPTWNVSDDLVHFIRDEYKGPTIRLHHLEVIGPFPIAPNELINADIYQSFLERPERDIDEILTEFATKAFRRPTKPEDIQPYIAFTKANLKSGMGREEALKWGFAGLLTSPKFLYLVEGNAEKDTKLDQYELASRLSYFLWSSMPDQALLDDAAAGKLTDKTVLKAHVERMIKSRKSDAFVNGFINSWLRLDKLGSMLPDNRLYFKFYKHRLETAMREETKLFFEDILHNNLPPLRFLDASYTFVNDALAEHYNINGEFGESFEKVELPQQSGRRGLTGHASILTASANGVDTSPVLRGVWVLENLLGTPPSPAPPDVPAIEPDIRGATTIREQLAKHRNVQACADCHAYIDPYGFPLEAFGPIGEYRTRYPLMENGKTKLNKGAVVDIATELATGEKIDTLDGFHQVLLQNERKFKMNLLSKLLTYGIGREPTFRDRPQIEAIIDQLDKDQAGLLDMVVAAVSSDIFETR